MNWTEYKKQKKSDVIKIDGHKIANDFHRRSNIVIENEIHFTTFN